LLGNNEYESSRSSYQASKSKSVNDQKIKLKQIPEQNNRSNNEIVRNENIDDSLLKTQQLIKKKQIILGYISQFQSIFDLVVKQKIITQHFNPRSLSESKLPVSFYNKLGLDESFFSLFEIPRDGNCFFTCLQLIYLITQQK